jgi:hypothetical protein
MSSIIDPSQPSPLWGMRESEIFIMEENFDDMLNIADEITVSDRPRDFWPYRSSYVTDMEENTNDKDDGNYVFSLQRRRNRRMILVTACLAILGVAAVAFVATAENPSESSTSAYGSGVIIADDATSALSDADAISLLPNMNTLAPTPTPNITAAQTTTTLSPTTATPTTATPTTTTTTTTTTTPTPTTTKPTPTTKDQSVSTTPSPTPDKIVPRPASGGMKEMLLWQTSTIRAAHGLGRVTWNDELAARMQAWADDCSAHPLGGHGGPKGSQNLASWSGPQTINQKDGAPWLWYADEEALFDYNTQKSRDGNWMTIGHFWNSVNPGVNQIACGWSTCFNPTINKDDSLVWCNYLGASNDPIPRRLPGHTRESIHATLTAA